MGRHNVLSDAFHCPPLSEYDRQELILQAKLACKYLVVDATASDSLPIENVVVNVKTGRHATARCIRDQVDSTLVGTATHTRVRASLGDVVSFFRLDSPSKVHDYARVMGDTFTEKVSLYTLLEAASSFDPDHTTAWQQQHSGTNHTSTLTHYVGVEWQLSKPKGFSPRDFCYLDYQDSFFFVDQATGQERRGWARCLHSVDLDCCPDMERSTGIIRAKMIRSGHVFVESTDKQGVLDYYKIYFIVPGGTVLKHFPSLYMKKMLKTFTTSALNLEEYLIQRRLRPILDVPVSTFPLKKDVAACMHCYHRFPWMATKKQCRSCGDVTCPKCSAVWSFHLDPSSYVKVHLCHQCVLDEADLPVAFAARTSRTTSRSSRVHSAPHRSLQCVRPPYAEPRSRVSDAHNRHTPDPRYSRVVYPMSSSQYSEPADGDDEQGRPRVITLDGASPQGNYNYHHHRRPRSRDDNNSNTSSHHRNHPQTPDDDDADGGIVVISPTDWRGSQLTSTSSVREALLTFHSDSSSIYL